MRSNKNVAIMWQYSLELFIIVIFCAWLLPIVYAMWIYFTDDCDVVIDCCHFSLTTVSVSKVLSHQVMLQSSSAAAGEILVCCFSCN